jgi:hypothetical protein
VVGDGDGAGDAAGHFHNRSRAQKHKHHLQLSTDLPHRRMNKPVTCRAHMFASCMQLLQACARMQPEPYHNDELLHALATAADDR